MDDWILGLDTAFGVTVVKKLARKRAYRSFLGEKSVRGTAKNTIQKKKVKREKAEGLKKSQVSNL